MDMITILTMMTSDAICERDMKRSPLFHGDSLLVVPRFENLVVVVVNCIYSLFCCTAYQGITRRDSDHPLSLECHGIWLCTQRGAVVQHLGILKSVKLTSQCQVCIFNRQSSACSMPTPGSARRSQHQRAKILEHNFMC